ncbi:MAG: MFS transporter [Candidatus Lokiarchaeota archaeon]|nr:MFS transporter [Candidatus Lokiarchaeota archaeon]
MSLTARFFGFENPTEQGLKLAKTMASLVPVFSMTFQISTTFYMLFIAEALGDGDAVKGMAIVGGLVALQFIVQVILDYPTGAVGDWVGQRYVIMSALLCYAVVFFLTSQLTPDPPLILPILIYALFGLGISQESGAWGAWFDNNYRVAMPHDTKREEYGVFSGKLGMISQISATAVLVPGSWIALYLGRAWVFQLQALLFIVLAILVHRYVRDLPEVEEQRSERPEMGDYVGLLKDGVRFIWSSKFFLLLFIGEMIFFSVGPVWGNLILWPFYNVYLQSDVAISTFRTLMFLPLAMTNERSGIIAKKYEPNTWIPRFRLFAFNGAAFYFLLSMMFFIVPPPPMGTTATVQLVIPFINLPLFVLPIASVIPILMIFIIFLITSLFGSVGGILTNRVLLDVVPNKIRNGMYSLRATSFTAASIPLLVFFGWLVPSFGFSLAFLLMGIISTVGVVLIAMSFKQDIPKAGDIEIEAVESEEVLEEIT